MATAKPKRKSGLKRAPAKRTPRKAKPGTRGLLPAECRLDSLSGEPEEVRARIEREGGLVLGAYSDPLGKNALLLAILPIARIEPTPFQRDLSQTHHRKLADVLDRTGMFLDPVIAVTAPKEGFWTPNGRHRLEAMRRLGARSITALVVPKREVAWQILALNTEKAHNLREKSLEVIRITRGLLGNAEDAKRAENQFAFYLEEASLVTLGVCYEQNGKFAGGAYNPIVRRLEKFSDESLSRAIKEHERHAAMLMDLDARIEVHQHSGVPFVLFDGPRKRFVRKFLQPSHDRVVGAAGELAVLLVAHAEGDERGFLQIEGELVFGALRVLGVPQ